MPTLDWAIAYCFKKTADSEVEFDMADPMDYGHAGQNKEVKDDIENTIRKRYAELTDVHCKRLVEYRGGTKYTTLEHAGSGWDKLPHDFLPTGYW